MRIVLVLIALGFGWYLFGTPKTKIATAANGSVAVKRGSTEATLALGEAISETWVLYGADPGIEFGDVVYSGLPVAAARELAPRYPDIWRCNSCMAEETKARLQSVNLIGADQKVGETLRKGRSEFSGSLGSSAPRICVSVQGRWATVNQLVKDGTTMKFDDSALFGHILVDSARIVDCATTV